MQRFLKLVHFQPSENFLIVLSRDIDASSHLSAQIVCRVSALNRDSEVKSNLNDEAIH